MGKRSKEVKAMDKREMKVEYQYSDCTMFINEEKLRRVTVAECNQGIGRRQMYSVRVVAVEPVTGNALNGETVATRCTHDQAMRIARQHYFA